MGQLLYTKSHRGSETARFGNNPSLMRGPRLLKLRSSRSGHVQYISHHESKPTKWRGPNSTCENTKPFSTDHDLYWNRSSVCYAARFRERFQSLPSATCWIRRRCRPSSNAAGARKCDHFGVAALCRCGRHLLALEQRSLAARMAFFNGSW